VRTQSARSGVSLPVMLKLAPTAVATRSKTVFSVLMLRYCQHVSRVAISHEPPAAAASAIEKVLPQPVFALAPSADAECRERVDSTGAHGGNPDRQQRDESEQ